MKSVFFETTYPFLSVRRKKLSDCPWKYREVATSKRDRRDAHDKRGFYALIQGANAYDN
jgi:hypothetical protein